MDVIGHFIKDDIKDIEKYTKDIKQNTKKIEKILKKTIKYWGFGYRNGLIFYYYLKDSEGNKLIKYDCEDETFEFFSYNGEEIVLALHNTINKIRKETYEENRSILRLLQELEKRL